MYPNFFNLNIMEEQLISYETAKLAKEKKIYMYTDHWYENTRETGNTTKPYGYNTNYIRDEIELESMDYPGEEGITDYINVQENKDHDIISYEKGFYFAPTQSLLQKWLREEHNINIGLTYTSIIDSESTRNYWTWRLHYKTNMYGNKDTYEKALEIALQEALKLI